MIFLKCVCILFSLCYLVSAIENKVQPRSLAKVLPFLGLGTRCNGCPQHFCDDDPAVVLGYCCGCAGFFDHLPIRCSPYMNCPANTFLLCQDYHYMLRCCC